MHCHWLLQLTYLFLQMTSTQSAPTLEFCNCYMCPAYCYQLPGDAASCCQVALHHLAAADSHSASEPFHVEDQQQFLAAFAYDALFGTD